MRASVSSGLLLDEVYLCAQHFVALIQQGLFLNGLAFVSLNSLNLLFQLCLGVPGLLKLIVQAAGIHRRRPGYGQDGHQHARGSTKKMPLVCEKT